MIMTTLEYPFKILIQTILKSFLLFKSFAHFVMNPGFFLLELVVLFILKQNICSSILYTSAGKIGNSQ